MCSSLSAGNSPLKMPYFWREIHCKRKDWHSNETNTQQVEGISVSMCLWNKAPSSTVVSCWSKWSTQTKVSHSWLIRYVGTLIYSNTLKRIRPCVFAEAITDLTRSSGFKKTGIPVYSCHYVYGKNEPSISLRHSFSLRLFSPAPPLNHLCPVLLIEN